MKPKIYLFLSIIFFTYISTGDVLKYKGKVYTRHKIKATYTDYVVDGYWHLDKDTVWFMGQQNILKKCYDPIPIFVFLADSARFLPETTCLPPPSLVGKKFESVPRNYQVREKIKYDITYSKYTFCHELRYVAPCEEQDAEYVVKARRIFEVKGKSLNVVNYYCEGCGDTKEPVYFGY